MKKTEIEIQQKLMKLLTKYTIDEIDVNMICKSLNIRRQTFYYHYKNIYNVIESIYYETIPELKATSSLEEINKELLGFLYANEDFNRQLLDSNAADILNTTSFSLENKAIFEYLKKYKLNLDQRRELARFIANSVSIQILYYFKNTEYDEDDILNKMSLLINEDIVKKITNNYIIGTK